MTCKAVTNYNKDRHRGRASKCRRTALENGYCYQHQPKNEEVE